MAAASEAAYGGGVQKGSLQLQQHQAPQPSPGSVFYTPDGIAVYAKPAIPPFYQQSAGSNAIVPAAPGLAHSSATSEPFKRKRGRPRKYGPADGAVPLAIVPPSQPPTAAAPAASEASPTIPPGFAPSPQGGGVVSPQASPAPQPPAASGAPAVKKRGRPPGPSSKKQQPQAAAPGNVLPSPFQLERRSSEMCKAALMALIVFLFRASDTRIYTCGTWEWAKRPQGLAFIYLSFHSFFFTFGLLSCRQQSGVELWAGNGILGDNDLYALGLLHARVFIQKNYLASEVS